MSKRKFNAKSWNEIVCNKIARNTPKKDLKTRYEDNLTGNTYTIEDTKLDKKIEKTMNAENI